MDDALLQSFCRIISERTGLSIRDQEINKLLVAISSRIRSLRLGSPDEYYRLLNNEKSDTALEWQELANALTTGETYFFRDSGQFALLKNWILPELIKGREADRTLRIWSAGCSSGEEAYSIAILVKELIRDLKDWEVFIIGTDINMKAVEKGVNGIYGEWSFRGAEPALRSRYFTKVKNGWLIDESLRRMVFFKVMNLITDSYPGDLQDMDLIVCRNVFIYFRPDLVPKVVSRFSQALRKGGYLMTGHAEMSHFVTGPLQSKVFPEAVVYQKNVELKPESRIQESEVRVEKSETRILDSEFCILDSKKVSPLDEAYAFANCGEYEKAAECCRKAIKNDPFNAEPYYLLAQISHEKGNGEEEKEMLKKVIYLNPSHVAAFLESGVIYENDGDPARARKMRKSALEILKKLSPEARIEPYKDFTAAELVKHLEKMIT